MLKLFKKYLVIYLLFFCSAYSTTAIAGELIMLEQDGCVWCERWNKEVGDIYPKTDEGKIAPLRRVDIHEEYPTDLKFLRPEHFTPTFVLVDNGIEIARLRGYTGDEFFWYLLNEMISKMKREKPVEKP